MIGRQAAADRRKILLRLRYRRNDGDVGKQRQATQCAVHIERLQLSRGHHACHLPLRPLYMHSALCRLALFPNVTIIPTVSEPQEDFPAIRGGLPTDHMPSLSPNDIVYTSGAPVMTESVGRIARAAGARCYSDPFLPTTTPAEQARARWAAAR